MEKGPNLQWKDSKIEFFTSASLVLSILTGLYLKLKTGH